jgi:hypothetical protein
MKLKKPICPICRCDLKNKLPAYIKSYFNTKEEIEKNTQITYNLIDIDDEYEFPPLG